MTTIMNNRIRRHKRVRAKVSGTAAIPRLCVFKSNTSTYAQLIDDEKATTLFAASDLKDSKGAKLERAKAVGAKIAELAKTGKITKVVFDRGGYPYIGRVAAVAEGAREGGLEF